MTAPDLIVEIVELALELVQSQADHKDATSALMDIVQKAVAAYQDHTGEALNPESIGMEAYL